MIVLLYLILIMFVISLIVCFNDYKSSYNKKTKIETIKKEKVNELLPLIKVDSHWLFKKDEYAYETNNPFTSTYPIVKIINIEKADLIEDSIISYIVTERKYSGNNTITENETCFTRKSLYNFVIDLIPYNDKKWKIK